jgi:two-component system response regulator AtoC
VTTGIGQRVLLIGPDDDGRRALHLLLNRLGADVAAASDLDTARRHFAAEDCDVVLAVAELAAAVRRDASAPVIAIVRAREVAASLALLAHGVDDVLSAPVDKLAITLALRRIAEQPRVRGGNKPIAMPSLIGESAVMRELKDKVRAVAAGRTTVLVTGESGTGKELVARAIHAESPRRERAFVACNCAAIPSSLLESELFGHVRGAFTDAVRDKPGLFEQADGGTLFLDEIGELPVMLQAKLLRVLQDSEIRRVGAVEAIHVDVRLIAATLRDLPAAIETGGFREDLYYRLAVVPIHVPSLRERSEDVAALARLFATNHCRQLGREVALTDDALAALAELPWPGNVRELENLIERAIVLSDGPELDLAAVTALLPDSALTSLAHENGESSGNERATVEPNLSIKKATRVLEAELIRKALTITNGNRTNTAKLLEISHRTLLYKMKEYGIS